MIMDSQQNSVDLNALATSVGVPFRLVENQAASAQTADVTFLTLPVSTTGKVPAVVIMHWLYCEWNISNF